MKKLFLSFLVMLSMVTTTSKSIDLPIDIKISEIVSLGCVSFLTASLPYLTYTCFRQGDVDQFNGTILCASSSLFILMMWSLVLKDISNRKEEKRKRNEELQRALEDIITADFISELKQVQEIIQSYKSYLKGKITLEDMVQAQGFGGDYEYPLMEYINVLLTPDSLKPTLKTLQYRLKALKHELNAAVPGRSKHDVSVISLEKAEEQSVVVENYINLISQLQEVLTECKSMLCKTDMYAQEVDRRNKFELQNALGKVNQQFEGVVR